MGLALSLSRSVSFTLSDTHTHTHLLHANIIASIAESSSFCSDYKETEKDRREKKKKTSHTRLGSWNKHSCCNILLLCPLSFGLLFKSEKKKKLLLVIITEKFRTKWVPLFKKKPSWSIILLEAQLKFIAYWCSGKKGRSTTLMHLYKPSILMLCYLLKAKTFHVINSFYPSFVLVHTNTPPICSCPGPSVKFYNPLWPASQKVRLPLF